MVEVLLSHGASPLVPGQDRTLVDVVCENVRSAVLGIFFFAAFGWLERVPAACFRMLLGGTVGDFVFFWGGGWHIICMLHF